MIYFDTDMLAEITEKDIIEQIIDISKGKFTDYNTYRKALEMHNAFVEKSNKLIGGKPFSVRMYLKRNILSEKTFALIIALSKKDETRKEVKKSEV